MKTAKDPHFERIAELEREVHGLSRDIAKKDARIKQLEAMINNPEIENFILGIRLEAAHQVERWGREHDEGKSPPDWFWLLGWLAGKAVTAANNGDLAKAKHHVISSAASLLNWHRYLSGTSDMRPGIADPEKAP